MRNNHAQGELNMQGERGTSGIDRRHATKNLVMQGVAASTLVTAATASRSGLADDGQTRLRVAVIGTGGMGGGHVRMLAARTDCDLVAVCDVDRLRLEKAAQWVTEAGKVAPETFSDMRDCFRSRQIDAVFIATPDHWHAPAALLALEAGKHVYVEKPCCHNLREGWLLEDAVHKSGKVLQVGTQSRSSSVVAAGIDRLRQGAIGQVLVAKAWNSQRRGSIGKESPTEPPAELDFRNWLGPARPVPYRRNLLHGVWRWWYDFGCGDIGNDGVHDVDVALWGLGVDRLPSWVGCYGAKDFFDDDQQFPDTQYAVCEFGLDDGKGKPKQLIFEQRIWSPYVQEGYENGAAFYGTEGMMLMGHNVGWKLYGARNELKEELTGRPEVSDHHGNFFRGIHRKEAATAPIEAGLLSAGVVHLANISARLKRGIAFDSTARKVQGDDEASRLLGREYSDTHWGVPKGMS
jgi:predicted dehydrogenase